MSFRRWDGDENEAHLHSVGTPLFKNELEKFSGRGMELETVILNEGAETPKRYTLHVAHVDGGCESSFMCTAFGILLGVRRRVRGYGERGEAFKGGHRECRDIKEGNRRMN